MDTCTQGRLDLWKLRNLILWKISVKITFGARLDLNVRNNGLIDLHTGQLQVQVDNVGHRFEDGRNDLFQVLVPLLSPNDR